VTPMNTLSELVLELTDWCPLACLHCSSNSEPNRNTRLEEQVVHRLLKEAKALGASQVSFGGGEPTASPLFVRSLQTVAKLGMKSEVFTCGVLHTGGKARPLNGGILERLSRIPAVKLIFSFHGATPQVHDQVTQTSGSFVCLMASLTAAIKAGILCEMNYVPMRLNAHQLEHLVELASDLGIRRVSLLRFVPQGRGLVNRPELELSREAEDTFVAELTHIRQERKVELRTGSPFNGIIPGNHVPCRAGSGKLVVQSDGNVLPCEVFKHVQMRCWGLSACAMSLGKMLGSPKIVALRRRVEATDCERCPVHWNLRTRNSSRSANAISAASLLSR